MLVEFETEGDAAASTAETGDEAPLADGLVDTTEGLEAAVPSTETARGDDRRDEADRREQIRFEPNRREDEERRTQAAAAKPAKKDEPKAEAAAKGGHVLASPAVRQRARDLGVDLASVKTSGDRVRHADLDAYLLYSGGAAPRTASPRRADETIKVVGLRRKIAENMQEAKRRIPHFTYVDEVDVTALEETRAMMNARSRRQSQAHPAAVPDHRDDAAPCPISRCSTRATTTRPMSSRARARSIWAWRRRPIRASRSRSSATRRTATCGASRARSPGSPTRPAPARRRRDELSGSTITISSLGPMGGIVSTPVINRPEVAIIAVNKVKEMPVVIDGELEIRKMMNLSLSCDHRVVDGWDAASFIQALKKLLENPLKLLSLR